MSSRQTPLLLRRWGRALRAPSGVARRVRRPCSRRPAEPPRALDSAISEVHAARLAMRNALLALDRAIGEGEEVDADFRRLIDTEISGTREEAAMLTALLAGTQAPGRAGVS